MFQALINGITDGAIMWMTVTGSILFPEVIPVVLCTGMILMYCKNPNFMDLERERYEMMMMEEENEEDCSDDDGCSNDEEEPHNHDITTTSDVLRNEISTLEAEIAELKRNIADVKEQTIENSNELTENTQLIDKNELTEKSDSDKKND